MRISRIFCLAVLCLALHPIQAQTTEDGRFARVFQVTPKDTARAQFADDYRNYLNTRRARRDPWKWYGWQVTSGPHTGAIINGTFDHFWSDFDATAPTDITDNLAGFLPSADFLFNYYLLFLPEVSRLKKLEDSITTQPYAVAEYYELWPGREHDFEELLHRTRDAYKRARVPRNYFCYRVFNGGRQPAYVILTPYERPADMQLFERGFTAVWDETLALNDAATLREVFRLAVREMSSETLRLRGDLSYLPGG